MATTTLLEYLTLPNPELDCSKSSTGANTFNARWDPITGLKSWTDLRYDTVMQMYGHVLLQPVSPLPETSPPLTELEKDIVTENTFEGVLKRAIMPNVSFALSVAWQLCYSDYGSADIAEIGKGDHARRGRTEEDDRYYADWAGVRKCEITNFGYKNLCPGETKLASKWSTSKEGRRRTDYTSPFRQIQAYCGSQWNVRHGYVITPDELVAIRVSRESVGPGLAALRAVREVSQCASNQPSHSRTFSTETVSSGIQAMSLDTGSSYHEDTNPNIEYRPLSFTSIPWSAAGEGVMTVKLGLWFLHMRTKYDVSVQNTYEPFTSLSGDHKVQSL